MLSAEKQQRRRTFEVQKDDRDVVLHAWQRNPVKHERKKQSTSAENRSEKKLRSDVHNHHSAGAPGIPLPAEGTMTAFLSSVRVKRHSSSWASLSMSSSVFSARAAKDENGNTQSYMNPASKYATFFLKKEPSSGALPALLTRLCKCWSRYSCLLVRAANHCLRRRSRSLSCASHQVSPSVRGSTVPAASSEASEKRRW